MVSVLFRLEYRRRCHTLGRTSQCGDDRSTMLCGMGVTLFMADYPHHPRSKGGRCRGAHPLTRGVVQKPRHLNQRRGLSIVAQVRDTHIATFGARESSFCLACEHYQNHSQAATVRGQRVRFVTQCVMECGHSTGNSGRSLDPQGSRDVKLPISSGNVQRCPLILNIETCTKIQVTVPQCHDTRFVLPRVVESGLHRR
jgi:hypothetical protein